eukprot:scaffold10858_cov44-Attheya_sp.AAC.1
MKLSSAKGNNDQSMMRRTKTMTMPRKKSKKLVKYGKAPQAPKRFKSAYMFFSTVMHAETRARLGHKGVKAK